MLGAVSDPACLDTQKGREYKRAEMCCVLDGLRLIYFWMTDSIG